MIRKLFVGVSLLLSSEMSFAIECIRPIEKLWTGHNSNKIYVMHGDGYGHSAMNLSSVGSDEAIVDRVLSLLLAAQVSGNDIIFRYVGSNASCTPSSDQQFLGVWLI